MGDLFRHSRISRGGVEAQEAAGEATGHVGRENVARYYIAQPLEVTTLLSVAEGVLIAFSCDFQAYGGVQSKLGAGQDGRTRFTASGFAFVAFQQEVGVIPFSGDA